MDLWSLRHVSRYNNFVNFLSSAATYDIDINFCHSQHGGVSLSYIGPNHGSADGSINDVRNYLWVAFIMASVCMVMIFIYLPDKPTEFFSSTMKRTYNLEGFYKLALNKPFVLLAISYGIMTGVYAGWGPLYCLIMQKIPRNIVKSPQVTASWIGFYSNVSGNISGLLFSFLSDMRIGKSRIKKMAEI